MIHARGAKVATLGLSGECRGIWSKWVWPRLGLSFPGGRGSGLLGGRLRQLLSASYLHRGDWRRIAASGRTDRAGMTHREANRSV